MKAWKKGAVVGGVWGLISGLLFFILPEALNPSFGVRTWTFIPMSIKQIITLPIHISVYIEKLFGFVMKSNWDIIVYAPISAIVSIVIGTLIGSIISASLKKYNQRMTSK